MSLKRCLDKLGVGGHEAAVLRGAARDYRRDGEPAQRAAVLAVEDAIRELMDERASVITQVLAAGLNLGSVESAALQARGHIASEAQQEAGNYGKGHAVIGPSGATMDISIENAAGTHRRPEWPALKDHYGYFPGTVAFDSTKREVQGLDVFFVPGTPADLTGVKWVWVVNQTKADRKTFDEHKVVIGQDVGIWNVGKVYSRNYEPGWRRFFSMVPMSWKGFRLWAKDTGPKGPKGGVLSFEVAQEYDRRANEVPAAPGRSDRDEGQAAPQRDLLGAAPVPGSDARILEALVVELEKQRSVKLPKGKIKTWRDAALAFRELNRWPRERFQMIGVSASGRPLAFYDLFAGTLTQTAVYPREIWTALYMTPGVKGVWFAHNHPSGAAQPSRADEMLTRDLRLWLGPTHGINYLGHIIIAGDAAVEIDGNKMSLAEAPEPEGLVSVPVLERVVRRPAPEGRAKLTSPPAVRAYLAQLNPTEAGLILLDARHHALGWWPMSLSAMENAEWGSAHANIVRMIGRNNPSAAMVYAPPGSDAKQVQLSMLKIANMMALADTRVIDAFIGQASGPAISLAERGQIPSSYPETLKRIDSPGGAFQLKDYDGGRPILDAAMTLVGGRYVDVQSAARTLAEEVEELEQRVDLAYETGDPGAEALDAQLAEMKDRLVGMAEQDMGELEPDAEAELGLERQLAGYYADYLKADPATEERALIIEGARDAIEKFGGKAAGASDAQVLAAMRDGYASITERAERRRAGVRSAYHIEQARPGMHPDAVAWELRKSPIAEALGRHLRIVYSPMELPDHALQHVFALGAWGQVSGYYDAVSDDTYLVANNIAPGTAERTLLHEAVGHAGIDAILTPETRKDYDAVMLEIYQSRHAEIKAAAESGFLRGYKLDLRKRAHQISAAREYIAHKAERGEEQSLWQRVVAAIRAALRKLGFVREWTENDILRLLQLARSHLINGGAADTFNGFPGWQLGAKGPVWYSGLERAVEQLEMNKAPATQWAVTIRRQPGVKAAEIAWSGLDDYLAMQAGKVVEKRAILEFLRENGVEVREKVLSTDPRIAPQAAMAEELHQVAAQLRQRGYETLYNEDGSLRGFEHREKNVIYVEKPAGAGERSIMLLPPFRGVRELTYRARVLAKATQGFGDREMGGEPRFRQPAFNLPGGLHPVEVVMYAPRADAWYGDDVPHYGDLTGQRTLAWFRANTRYDTEGKKVLFLEEVQSRRGEAGREFGFEPRDEALEQHIEKLTGKPHMAVDFEDLEKIAAPIEVAARWLNYSRSAPRAPLVEKTEQWTALVLKRAIRWAADHGYERIAWTTGDQQGDRYARRDQARNAIMREGMQEYYDKILVNVANDVLGKLGGGRVGKVVIDVEISPNQRVGIRREEQPGFDITPAMRDVALAGLPLFQLTNIPPSMWRTAGNMRWEKDGVVLESHEDVRRTYFTPGTIVRSYGGGHDRVLAYTPNTGDWRGWAVTVEAVVQRNGEWVKDPSDPRVRSHATEPEAKNVRSVLTDAGWKPAKADVHSLTQERIRRGHRPAFQLREERGLSEVYGVRDGRLLGMAQRAYGQGAWEVYLANGTNENLFARGQFRRVQASTINEVQRIFNREGLELRVIRPQNTPVPDRSILDTDWLAPQADTWLKRAIIFFQNRLLLPELYERAIRRQVGEIPDEAKAHREARLAHPRAAGKIADFEHEFIEPILDLMKQYRLSLKEVGQYLYARHAPERNAAIEAINPDNKTGSGMSDERAASVMDSFRQAGKLAQLSQIGDLVNRITTFREAVLLDKGLAKQEVIVMLRERYPNYVPLKELAEDEFANLATQAEVAGGYQVGRIWTRAFGRFTEAQSEYILPGLIAQAKGTIAAGENAEVLRAFLRQVQVAPNPEVWSIQKHVWKPYIDKQTGEVRYAPRPIQIDANFSSRAVSVPVAGERHVILVEDQRLATAFKTSGLPVPEVFQAIGHITRFYALMATAANPEFVVTNLLRDFQQAVVRISGEQNPGLAAKVAKDVLPALWGAFRGLRQHGVLPQDAGTWRQWYQRYIAAGGHVAYRGLNDAEQQHKDFLTALAEVGIFPESAGGLEQARLRMHRTAKVMGAKWFTKLIVDANGAVENALRLATFKNAIEAGWTEKDAAFLARNVTVDFNLRGEAGARIGALYMFFNANIQGSALLFRSVVNHKAIQALVLLLFLSGMGFDAWNRRAARRGVDNRTAYDNISHAIKERNFVLMAPDGENAITVPLPFGFNVFYVLGTKAMSVIDGVQKPLDAAGEGFITLVNAFSPFGSSPTSWLGALQLLAPTFADPAVQAMTNRNFMDKAISPERPKFASPQADSATYFAGTPQVYVDTARWLNDATGGNDVRPGLVDISPNMLQHWVRSIFGGAGAFYTRATEYIGAKALGQDVETRNVPFLRRFYYEPLDFELSQRFYENVNSAEMAHKEVERAMVDGDRDRAAALRGEFEWERKNYAAAQDAERKVAAIRSQIAKLRRDERMDPEKKKLLIERMQEQARTIMQQFNARFERADR